MKFIYFLLIIILKVSNYKQNIYFALKLLYYLFKISEI